MERRLAAIVAIDVVGYSRLMAQDEEGTIARLNAAREDIIGPPIARFGGRIVKTMGDGILVEFLSVVDAVRAALEIQRFMAERSVGDPVDRRLVLRMGINLGDVVVDGEDILGDGVNVAARLEALSDPGGISISRAVRDQIRDKLEVGLEDQGEVSVKNMARPVRVFRVLLAGEASAADEAAAQRTVLAAEAQSFGLLMGRDDAQAQGDLTLCGQTFIEALEQHGGQAVDRVGDGIVAIFETPVEAVQGAVEAQVAVATLNQGMAPERRVRFRVGIALGDAGSSGGAGTMEALAAPGEVCVSPEVHERLSGNSGFDLAKIANPSGDLAGFRLTLPKLTESPVTSGLPLQCQALDLPLPAKPSIIVLPFKDLSPNAELGHLTEGIRIDVQCALVKISGLFAIAAGTASCYAGRDVTAQQVGRDMGVKYVLEGTVQSLGDRLRVTAQLTDTDSGESVWAERYDRQLDGSFLVQDEIVERIVTALDVELVGGEQAKVWRKTLRDPKALEIYYKGLQRLMTFDKESVAAARQHFETVSRMAPNVTLGPTNVAFCHYWDAIMGWSDTAEEALAQAAEWAEKAAAMDDADGQAHIILAHVHLLKRRHEDALRIGQEAVEIRPLCANTNALFGNILIYCGRSREAIERVKNAIRTAPVYAPWWVELLAIAYRDSGQYGRAISAAKEAIALSADKTAARAILASACVAGGWLEAAREVADSILEMEPAFSVASYSQQHPYRDPETLEALQDRLRAAGLPG